MNQTLMLALSMVVIASMIAVGGVDIVILAIILDRLTQSLGRDSRSRGNQRWFATGPLGLILRPFTR